MRGLSPASVVVGVVFLLLLSVIPAGALMDPSAVYCTSLGYEFIIEMTPVGEWGYCILPSGEKVDSWKFLEGKTGAADSYCRKIGLQIKTVRDPERCIQFLTDECAVCILANGTEVEVTQLMGLSFAETTCGDGTCGMPENYTTCPQDCPSGSEDGYCDGIHEGICDFDCSPAKDPDCIGTEKGYSETPTPETSTQQELWAFPLTWSIGFAALLIIAVILYLVIRRWKKGG